MCARTLDSSQINLCQLSKVEVLDDEDDSFLIPDQSSFFSDEPAERDYPENQIKDGEQNFVKLFEEDTCRYYEGEMRDGLKEGYGIQLLENGDKYEGQWI